MFKALSIALGNLRLIFIEIKSKDVDSSLQEFLGFLSFGNFMVWMWEV